MGISSQYGNLVELSPSRHAKFIAKTPAPGKIIPGFHRQGREPGEGAGIRIWLRDRCLGPRVGHEKAGRRYDLARGGVG